MKKAFALLLFVSALGIASCGPSGSEKKPDSPAQQATLYQCPMKCEGDKTYDAPGKCPVCGMDLKPVEAVAPAGTDTTGHSGDSTRSV